MKGQKMITNEDRAFRTRFGLYDGQCLTDDFCHNAGWYSADGKKRGWGDISRANFLQIQSRLTEDEIFVVLPESASFWNFVKENNGPTADFAVASKDINNPGVQYVKEMATYVITKDKIWYKCRFGKHGDKTEFEPTYKSKVGLVLHYFTDIDLIWPKPKLELVDINPEMVKVEQSLPCPLEERSKEADGKASEFALIKFSKKTREEVSSLMSLDTGYKFGDLISSYEIRRKFVAKCSWSIPCKEAFDAFKNYSFGKKILDVMAGSGYWVKLLQDEGLDAEASDIAPGEENDYKHSKSWVTVERCDGVEMVKNNQHADIIVAWPPYDEAIGTDIINEIKRPGAILYSFGEGYHGCTGNSEFHETLDDESKWERVATVDLPQWDGIHDRLMIWRKK